MSESGEVDETAPDTVSLDQLSEDGSREMGLSDTRRPSKKQPGVAKRPPVLVTKKIIHVPTAETLRSHQLRSSGATVIGCLKARQPTIPIARRNLGVS